MGIQKTGSKIKVTVETDSGTQYTRNSAHLKKFEDPKETTDIHLQVKPDIDIEDSVISANEPVSVGSTPETQKTMTTPETQKMVTPAKAVTSRYPALQASTKGLYVIRASTPASLQRAE